MPPGRLHAKFSWTWPSRTCLSALVRAKRCPGPAQRPCCSALVARADHSKVRVLVLVWAARRAAWSILHQVPTSEIDGVALVRGSPTLLRIGSTRRRCKTIAARHARNIGGGVDGLLIPNFLTISHLDVLHGGSRTGDLVLQFDTLDACRKHYGLFSYLLLGGSSELEVPLTLVDCLTSCSTTEPAQPKACVRDESS